MVPPSPESFLCAALLTHAVTPEIVLSKLALVTGLSLYDREGYYLGHFKSVTALYLHFIFSPSAFPQSRSMWKHLGCLCSLQQVLPSREPLGALARVFPHIMLVTSIFKVCAVCPAFRKLIFLNKRKKYCTQQLHCLDLLWFLTLFIEVKHSPRCVICSTVCKAYTERLKVAAALGI